MTSTDRNDSIGPSETLPGRVRGESGVSGFGAQRTLGAGAADDGSLQDDIAVVDLAERYSVEGTLGQGGMGAVVLATDNRLGRKVAIKRILGEAAGNRMAVARFLTEAKAIAALNHQNIVQIYDYGRAMDGPFLIMEYVDGGSLLDRCQAGPIPLEEAIDLACRICDGLAKAHDLGIIHRDIKPANVLLTKDGIPKLTDFGLAKDVNTTHHVTVTGAVMGTPDFMPPEQAAGAGNVDHRSDIWSLAATIYQMLTGKSPKVIQLKGLPQSAREVLGRAMQDAKDARYQSAREFRDVLRKIAVEADGRSAPAAGGLQEGQCSACGTINSDLNRKFCRNASCVAPLRVACLGCSTPIPVWDAICGECGAKQAELSNALAQKYSSCRESAERSLANYEFVAAEETAVALEAIDDNRFKEFADWAATFRERISRERANSDAFVNVRLQEAASHREAFDYAAAIDALERLPEPLRSGKPEVLLKSLQSEREESRLLLETIRGRIAAKQLDGLLPVASRALELRGNREDLRRLVEQLQERDERMRARTNSVFATATQLFAAGDAKAALEQVANCNALQPQQVELKSRLSRAVKEEEKLSLQLAAAKADGVLTPEEVSSLLEQVGRCLAVNPGNTKIVSLQGQLSERKKRHLIERERKKTAAREVEARPIHLSEIGGDEDSLRRETPTAADSSVRQRVVGIIAAQLGVSENVISLETNIVEDLGADSLDMVEIVMEIEEEFEVMIPDEVADKVRSVGEAIRLLESEL